MGSWNHVVLEGYCSYEDEEFKDVPCCDIKPGMTSIVCFGKSDSKRCSYFSYIKAPSCIVLTDDKGFDTACNTFFVDETNESEYIRKENIWIEDWKKLIEKDKG